MFENLFIENGQELTLERLREYIKEKIDNDSVFTFDEIRMTELCGFESEFYTPDDPLLIYKHGYFYTLSSIVQSVDNDSMWYKYKWKYGPNKPKMVILGLIEKSHGCKIFFDESDTNTVLLRYIRETYNISDSDIITAVVTINKNLPSFDNDRVVYVKPDELHSRVEAYPPVSFRCPEGKLITEADVNNKEYTKACVKEFTDTFCNKREEKDGNDKKRKK